MEIYFILLTATIVLSVFPAKIYTILMTVFMGLIAAFRDDSVGTDTFMYNGIYNGVNQLPFEWSYYDSTLTEIGDRFFMILAKDLFDMSQGYIILSSLITFICFGIFFYKAMERKYLWIVMFCFISLHYYAFSLNALRQVLAISIGIFFYICLKRDKCICAFIPISIAALFHLSVLIYVPIVIYAAIINKTKNKLGIKRTSLFLMILSLGEYIIIYIGYKVFMSSPDILGEKYLLYASNAYSDALNQGVSIITIGILICIVVYIIQQILNRSLQNDNTLLMILSLQYIVFAFATDNIMGIIFRITVLFSPFIMLLIGKVIENTKNQYIRLISIFVLIIFGYINLYYHMPDDVIPYKSFF